MNRVESAAAGVTVWGSIVAWALASLNWLSANLSAVSAIVLLGGFVIQCVASIRNRSKQNSDEQRAQAEERRRQEEHGIKMAILRGDLPDRRTPVQTVEDTNG